MDQLPCFKADECILDSSLMILHHVLVHGGIVLPDVPLRGSVWNRPEAERRRVRVRILKLKSRRTMEGKHGGKEKEIKQQRVKRR